MATEFDHLVLATADLAAGQAWLEDMLGVPAQGGGQHANMGTHNKVWSLGSCFLELIAIDPEGTKPDRPRWFSLDDPALQQRIASGPRLITWAVRVDDLEQTAADSLIPLGTIHELSRGDLRWKVAIPDDGAMLQGGHVPLVIQWLTTHPAQRLPDSGLRLSRLVSEQEDFTSLKRVLDAIGAGGLIEYREGELQSSLMAEVQTSDGNVGFVG